jgi:cation diffusion facilitator family transporter
MQNAHRHDLEPFAHSHSFADAGQSQRERALSLVTAVTLVTMVLELVVGWWTSSLALTADGWHMGTHALALGGAVLAYRLSQRAATQRGVAGGAAGFAFGGWKIEVLTAYTSGLLLLGVALWLVWEGVDTLRHPKTVDYRDALLVAVLGLVVNVLSVWLLSRGAKPAVAHADEPHTHAKDHAHHVHHDHSHAHGHAHDHNFSAAYLHVMADAFTSVLAIAALAGGLWFGVSWLDPVVALLGAVVIAHWSLGVLRGTARALVDATEDPALLHRIRELIESDGDAKVADLHLWQVGAKAWSAAISVVADQPRAAADYRQRLQGIDALGHVTVEVHRCPNSPMHAAH